MTDDNPGSTIPPSCEEGMRPINTLQQIVRHSANKHEVYGTDYHILDRGYFDSHLVRQIEHHPIRSRRAVVRSVDNGYRSAWIPSMRVRLSNCQISRRSKAQAMGSPAVAGPAQDFADNGWTMSSCWSATWPHHTSMRHS